MSKKTCPLKLDSVTARRAITQARPMFILSLLAASVGQAWAQVAAPAAPASAPLATAARAAADSADSQQLDAVLVTAQKRPEKAQTTPVSLTAITGKTLEAEGISGLGALDQVAAGLTIGTVNPGQSSLSMRGISNLGGGFFTGPATGVYIDESPISAFFSIVPEIAFWDAERVEVLRGPQGTLFGEGSMGGTIRIITTKPEADQFAARVQGIYSKIQGGGNGYTARAMVNLPLIQDQLALRVTGSHQDIIGWIDVPDLAKKDANKGKQEDGRVALRWTPSKALTVDLSYSQQYLQNGEFQGTSPGVFQPSALGPGLQPVSFITTNATHSSVTSGTISYDLGSATVVGTVSHFYQNVVNIKDDDPLAPLFFGGKPSSALSRSDPIQQKATTEEVRVVSNGDQRLNWTVGLYHKESSPKQAGGFDISVPAFGISHDLSFSTPDASLKANAVFADGEFKITDTVAVQAGLRYYKADYRTTTTNDTTSALFGTVAGTVQDSTGTGKATTPKLGLSWKPASDVLLYAKFAEGFRDGGSNFLVATEPVITPSFGPEKVYSYEVGFKTQPQRWLTINGAIYRNTWKDLQLGFVTADGLFGYTANAGRAKATGGELEVVARPAAGLRVGANFAYIDSKIDGTVVNALGGVVAADGNYIPFAPKTQLSVFGSYQQALTETLAGVASANFSRRGSTYSEPSNDEARRNKAFNNLYLKAGIQADRWNASLFVSNALNSDATNAKNRYIGALPIVYNSYVQPRTFGVEFNASY